MINASHLQIVASALGPITDGDRRMAPDPEATELLQSQVILPFSLSSTTHAFLGPLLTPKEAQKDHSFLPLCP